MTAQLDIGYTTSHLGNNQQKAFSAGFKAFSSSLVKVYVDGVLKTITTDYTIQTMDSGSNAQVIFVTAPAYGSRILISRDPFLETLTSNPKSVVYLGSIAELRAFVPNIDDINPVYLNGKFFYWDSTSNASDDGASVVKTNSPRGGRWLAASSTNYSVVSVGDGSVTAPSLSFSAAPTTGISRLSSGQMLFSIAGVEKARLAGTQFLTTGVDIQSLRDGNVVSNYMWSGFNNALPNQFSSFRNRGTVAVPVISNSLDDTLEIRANAYSGSAYVLHSNIKFKLVEPTPSTTAMGGAIIFANTQMGTVVAGVENARITGSATAAAPTLTLGGDTDTGFYPAAANIMGFSAGGAAVATFSASGISAPFIFESVNNGLAAAGANQGTALVLSTSLNVVTTVTTSSADGVRLPTAITGMKVVIWNTSANTLKVYPATGAGIDAIGTNLNDTITTLSKKVYYATSTTQWRAV